MCLHQETLPPQHIQAASDKPASRLWPALSRVGSLWATLCRFLCSALCAGLSLQRSAALCSPLSVRLLYHYSTIASASTLCPVDVARSTLPGRLALVCNVALLYGR